ncbi:MAG: TonB-dependent receptor [Alphaproteobacteria bacterium]
MTWKFRRKRTGLNATLAACATAAWTTAALAQQTAQTTETPQQELQEVNVTATRLGTGIAGTSTTILTEEDIKRSPDMTLQDLLSRQAGIQVQNLFGGVDGARDTIDMRGFGASAVSNTLVLVNGRRLNDVDMAGVDFTAIPKDSIEHIEIVRGNAGVVLYGDGAMGGVINIITKTGVAVPNAYRADLSYGSFDYTQANIAANQSVGSLALALYGTYINSNGYRENNDFYERNIQGDARYQLEGGELYLTVSADTQRLGLPAGRLVTLTTSQVVTDPTGTSTPNDYANKQGLNVTLGGTHKFSEGVQAIIDAGVRNKDQQSGFFSSFGPAFDSYNNTTLTTSSFTPRLDAQHLLGDMPGKLLTGVDTYGSLYDSDRMLHQGDAAIHHYDLTQITVGPYFQETVTAWGNTDIALGARTETAWVSASDTYDASAPGGAGGVQGLPYNNTQTDWGAHLGASHNLSDAWTLFGRLGRSFRLPNVDERVGSVPFGVPPNFALRTQTSRDIEGGFRLNWRGLEWQTSAYVMSLNNEIFFSPANFTNTNLDPTRRVGVENGATYRISDPVMLKGSLTYIDATFRSGQFDGNEIPLVSRWTGNAGISWNVFRKYIMLDADLRYIGPRRFDNDAANFQPMMPSVTLVDLKVSGQIDRFNWALTVQNLLNKENYFDYGIASAATYGTYNAYPMPGRNFTGKIGIKF